MQGVHLLNRRLDTSAFYHLPVTVDQDQADGEPTSYDGPIVAVRSVHEGNSWIWVANGSVQSEFAPPETVSPSASHERLDVGPARMSDRVIESFRIEALDLDTYDPLVDELFELADDHVVAVEGDPVDSAPPDRVDPGIEVRVLGPVEIVGWKTQPERAVVSELACFLVMHRSRPVSGELLRVALRPEGTNEQSAKTIRTYVSLLRKALGPEALPTASSGGYQLSPNVRSDWELFVELAGGEPAQILEALALVRGRPFQGVPKGSYGWVFSEFLVSDMEVAIVRASFAAAGQLVALGDLDGALWAVRQGLLGVNGDFGLWQRYLSLSAERGPAALARAQAEARAALGDDAPAPARGQSGGGPT
jgi:hypothetical protein